MVMVHPQHLQHTELPEAATQNRGRPGPQQRGATAESAHMCRHLANTDPDPFFSIILPEYLDYLRAGQSKYSQKTL